VPQVTPFSIRPERWSGVLYSSVLR
jgi:hypothetical protein